MEKNNKKKHKLSGYKRKKMKEVAIREKESSEYVKLDTYFSFGKLATPSAPKVQVSKDLSPSWSLLAKNDQSDISPKPVVAHTEHLLNTYSPAVERSVSTVVLARDVKFSEDSLELGTTQGQLYSILDSSASQVVEVRPCEELVTSVMNHPEDEAFTIKVHPIIGTNSEYPTDPNLYCDILITPDIIRILLELGPCQPGLKDSFNNFPKDEPGRHFSTTWYKQKQVQGGREIDRHWLVYSPTAKTMLCFACWLFSNRSDAWSNPKTGCKNFSKGTHKIEKHEKSGTHKKAEKDLFLTKFRLLNDRTVVAGLLTAERREIEKYRMLLTRIIDAVLFLSKQGLAFRGHREYGGLGSSSINEGNFLELIKLLSKNDTLLEQHLLLTDRNATYLSPVIQNDLIQSLSAHLRQRE